MVSPVSMQHSFNAVFGEILPFLVIFFYKYLRNISNN